MRVIAEGIESTSQVELLNGMACDFGQGYLFAKPQRPEIIEELLHQTARNDFVVSI